MNNKPDLVVGIDASNLRQGGGVTHLIELLQNSDPTSLGIKRVVVWGSQKTLSSLKDEDWLTKINPKELDSGFVTRMLWQFSQLTPAAKAECCDVIFAPGGNFAGAFKPLVTMSQNLTPFEWRELKRYGFSLTTIRLLLLRWSQAKTFKKANGMIFLTEYAKARVTSAVGDLTGEVKVIPHGLNKRFLTDPKDQKPISYYCPSNPYRILYVSIVDKYKHQWHVVEAVSKLRKRGLPVVLDLIGPSYTPAMSAFQNSIDQFDPSGEWVRYHGPMPYEDLHNEYRRADLGVFASSCENLPIILIETMAAGLPIACSNRGPMPEVLQDSGVYFDPESPEEIAAALQELIDSQDMRRTMSQKSFIRAQQFSWEECARETFSLIRNVAQKSERGMEPATGRYV